MNRRELIKVGAASLAATMLPLPANARTTLRADAYLRTNWSQDPLAYGSYSYTAKGSKQRDRRRLAEPVDGTLFFAGEACHPNYNSTVHAAYESGVLAAEDLLKTSSRNVAIIGAGMSGLAAEKRLSDNGRQVTVFEARDRIGGRIWTNETLGIPLDLGASWIHGIEDNPLTELSDEIGLERIMIDDSYVIRGEDGKRLDDLPAWMEEVTSIQHTAGTELRNLNWLSYLMQSDYEGDDVVFPNGYSQIFDALSGQYDLRLNHKVSVVDLTSGGVSLTVEGEVHEFDAVIVTLPLGVLKQGNVQFSPPLPRKKQRAIDRLGVGLLDKLYVKFEDVFWDQEQSWIELPETGLPHGQFNQWLNIYKYSGEPILMAFNGATPAHDLSELSDEDLLSRALSTLSRAYP